MTQAPRVCLGVITAPHGVRGMVRIKSFTDDPASIAAYGPVMLVDGRAFTIEIGSVKKAQSVVLARLDGIASRDEAEALKGEALFVERAALPAPDDGAVYQADLIGRVVRDETLGDIGTVIGVHDFGGGGVLEIKTANDTAFVPFGGGNAMDITGDTIRLAVDPVWLEG